MRNTGFLTSNFYVLQLQANVVRITKASIRSSETLAPERSALHGTALPLVNEKTGSTALSEGQR